MFLSASRPMPPVPKDVAIMRPPIQCDDSETRTLSCSARLRRHGTQLEETPPDQQSFSATCAARDFVISELRRLCRIRSNSQPTPVRPFVRRGETRQREPVAPGLADAVRQESQPRSLITTNPAPTRALPFSYFPESESATKHPSCAMFTEQPPAHSVSSRCLRRSQPSPAAHTVRRARDLSNRYMLWCPAKCRYSIWYSMDHRDPTSHTRC